MANLNARDLDLASMTSPASTRQDRRGPQIPTPVIPANGDLCVAPPVGDSVAEMASIPGGEPPTLDSRLRGNDGCAKVSLRGKDGCSKVSLRGKDGCSKVSERGNPFLPRCAATTPRAVRHAGRPNPVANLGARRGTKRRRSIRGIGRCWQSARTRRRRGESPRRIEAPCLWPVSAASASSSRSSPRWARRPATRARPGPSRPCRRGR